MIENLIETTNEEFKRPRGRPKMIDRAPQRSTQRINAAAELRDWDEDDKFKIYPEEIPEGFSYEWKRLSIRGMEDRSHQTKLRQMGFWSAVPGDRLPRFGFAGDQSIVIDELILMERPIEYTEERRSRDEKKAKSQVNDQMNALEMTKPGTFDRTKPKVKRSMEIPD